MTAHLKLPLPPAARSRTVTAVLGPTNTGKTHLAIERMLGHETGMIGLPLRLLAREVYGRVADKAGQDSVALVTGEEKIIPPEPRYWVSTVEAMPLEISTDFVAVDEVQLAADLERGHIFTHRILNVRGTQETLLLGAATVRKLLERLLPGLNVVTRPRMSVLAYSGSKKITRLPPRSAAVAFSSNEVYAIAELVRRQRGGAAVVLGSLSPRTRNAQVELFQSGDVDILVATDAIGMGLNLDVDHVAFAGNRKFDGYQYRQLSPAELGQIAGRAGRHMHDGTFGVTGRVDPFDDELVETLETHHFQPVKVIQWRNAHLDYSDLQALRNSLDAVPTEKGLTRAPGAQDVVSLEMAAKDPDIRDLADKEETVRLLWNVCQIPDYRKIAPANHAELVNTIFTHLVTSGTVPEDWFSKQISFADRIDGDIDTLANRIAHVRTWTFVANRGDWLSDRRYWQEQTRAIEDRLSDALHERLTQRFVDRRTSVLMRRLRENAMMEAEITPTGDVLVEGQHIGHLHGFRFAPDASAEGQDEKAVRGAAMKALSSELEARAEKISKAPNEDFVLSSDGSIRWLGESVAKLTDGETPLTPGFHLIADEQLNGPAKEKVRHRIDLWIKSHIETLLKPLFDLQNDTEFEGLSRGMAFRLVEKLGIVERQEVAEDVRQLDQTMRGTLRKCGVRFGAHHIYVPALLKPAPSQLIAMLWALKHGDFSMPGLAELPQLSASGRTSIPVDSNIKPELYRIVGFRICGDRAVRVDILERLADLIRPLISWRKAEGVTEAPEGAIPEGGGFTVTVAMTSLLGCSGEAFASILQSLGYRLERRELPPEAVADGQTATAEKTEPAAIAAPPEGKEDNASAPPATTEEKPAEMEISPEPADTAPAETPPGADASSDTAEPVVSDETDTDAAKTAETAVKETAGSDPEISAKSDAEEDGPKFLEIWRPARSGRRDGHRNNSKRDGQNRQNAKSRNRSRHQDGTGGGHKGPRKDGGGQGKRQGANRAHGKPQGRPRSKPAKIDPDSPFAALAALKEDLEKTPDKK